MHRFKYALLILFLLTLFSCKENKVKVIGEIEGDSKYNPSRFTLIPDTVAFELTMKLNKDTTLNDKKVLNMKLKLQNPSKDTMFLTTSAGTEPYYDFVITKPDCTRIWSRIQSTIRRSALFTMTLEPSGSHKFSHTWNYTDYNGKNVKPGKYLVYGGIESLGVSGSSFRDVKELGDIGVKPDTIIILD